MTLHYVACLADLHEGQLSQATLGDHTIVLWREGDTVRAYQGECPHARAPLADGAVCNGRLVCPWHKAVFRLSDGHVCEPPALEDLQRYAVTLQDGQVYVDDQPLPPEAAPRSEADTRLFVVVGAGAAGTAGASALREHGFAGRVLLIDREQTPGYDRTVLSKFVIAGEMAPAQIPDLKDDDFYRQQRIERVHGHVHRVDAQRREIELSDGRQYRYDSALLATGAEPKTLDVPGAQLHNVHVLRSRAHAANILHATQPGDRAVVIGDSFIGLEAASALRKRGLSVTVIARHEVPFAKQFGLEIGRAIRLLHESNGVVFRVGEEAVSFESGHAVDDQQVQAVRLACGERIAADLVLLGVGVSPATDLLHGLRLCEDGALAVDQHMRAAPGLWAAGDIARFPLADEHLRIEHWRVAQQHARVAAQNMLGTEVAYEGVPFFWTQHFGKRFDYLGLASDWEETVIEGDLVNLHFVALLCTEGKVEGVVTCQQEALAALLAERLREPLTVDEALGLIRAAAAA
ncbi:FAD-dependent oxidoreductase [Pseudomonas turukhanskensis]|uniref:Pyridine nucleotide-disulfide oxidoreductase n=1 Tax=Pseudomonas turukhanskensis TaxID=1806536 RepID=A0A9W6K545_9PSED|nr:FAD-dependent oxidoreductase [Pseudomonas turukhanskensis]GLK88982.1 pyridine nucleotide-disulfide oxidoreductase [Pseudomonas turukhanskensis]